MNLRTKVGVYGRLALVVAVHGCAAESGGRTQQDTRDAGQRDASGLNTAAPAPSPALIATRIRRLTNAEYDASVHALLGTEQTPGAGFVPDARLHKFAPFARNEAQIVDPVWASQVQQAAEQLAAEYVSTQLERLACASDADAACAVAFFEEFVPRAFRRAVRPDEVNDLLVTVVNPELVRSGFESAVQGGIAATLQSAGFLYHTELGDSTRTEEPSTGEPAIDGGFLTVDSGAISSVALTREETAAELAYLLTGAPPDAELQADEALFSAAGREAQARRLLQTDAARGQVRQMVKQWLGTDRFDRVVKDVNKYPDFSAMRSRLARESDEFIDEVVFGRNGGATLLLGADFTVGSAELAKYYAAPAPSVDTTLIHLDGLPRRGLLNQAAFLATYATTTQGSPVKRGARLLSQVLCVDPGDPNALSLRVTPPPLDPGLTTRQRFEAHAVAGCVGCHGMIDSVGFTFGHFSAVGAWEAEEDGNTQLPIDSRSVLALPQALPFATQTVADSAELMREVSASDAARRCFARNLARFVSAAYGATLEERFEREWQRLADAGQDSVQELLVAYVKSEAFVERDANGGAP